MLLSEIGFLIVEDDSFQRKLLVQMIREIGVVNVFEAENGFQALDVLNEENTGSIHIVLSDLSMPDMDGVELLRYFSEQNKEVAVAIVSSMGARFLASIEKMAVNFGVRLLGVVEKPVLPVQLNTLIADYINSVS